jgi:hypothetical protein
MTHAKLVALLFASLFTVGMAGFVGGSPDHEMACTIGDCW